jgi:omega-6 fatty acid desaturase (delta-12 desaturase)
MICCPGRLIIDTAWQPFRPYMYDRSKGFARFAMEAAMGPLWWMASVGHWLFWHFDLSKYRPQDVKKVKVGCPVRCVRVHLPSRVLLHGT